MVGGCYISVIVLLISNPSLLSSPMQYHFFLPIGSLSSLLQRDMPSWEALLQQRRVVCNLPLTGEVTDMVLTSF